MSRALFPSDDYSACPNCGGDNLVDVEMVEEYRSLSQIEPGGSIAGVYTGETSDATGNSFISCRSCITEWDWPEDAPEVDWR